MTGEAEQRARDESRLDQAADWHLRLEQADRGGELTSRELDDVERFFSDPNNAEPLHLTARVSSHLAAWRQRGFLGNEVGSDPRCYRTQTSERESEAPVGNPRPPGADPRRRWAIVGLAFMVIAMVAVGLKLRWYGPGPTDSPGLTYRTGAAQNQRVTLPDGSHVTLGLVLKSAFDLRTVGAW